MFKFKSFPVIFCWCSLQFFTPAVHAQNIDVNILKSINPQNPKTGFWSAVSDYHIAVAGAATFGTLAYALIKHDKNLQYKSYETLIAAGINVVATDALKIIFNRTRPADKYPNDIYVLTISHGHSFPSGHTSLAFAAATSLMLNCKKWYIVVPGYMWAGCVGYSRMYLGKHYPSDVLAGAVVGAGSALASHWVSKKLFQPKQVNEPKQAGF